MVVVVSGNFHQGQIQCQAPTPELLGILENGVVELDVCLNGRDFHGPVQRVFFFTQVRLVGVSPNRGPATLALALSLRFEPDIWSSSGVQVTCEWQDPEDDRGRIVRVGPTQAKVDPKDSSSLIWQCPALCSSCVSSHLKLTFKSLLMLERPLNVWLKFFVMSTARTTFRR